MPGERVILTGANGSGKTTLLKTALGLIPCDHGSIAVARGLGPGRFAYLPQELQTGDLPIAVREVVEIGLASSNLSRREKRRKILHLLEALGCAHLIERSFTTLSGGEKQRVSLARCLAQSPALLVLDEPTTGLDPQLRARFFPLIEELAEFHGAAVLLVTHDTAGLPSAGWRRLRLEESAGGSRLAEDAHA